MQEFVSRIVSNDTRQLSGRQEWHMLLSVQVGLPKLRLVPPEDALMGCILRRRQEGRACPMQEDRDPYILCS